MRDKHYLTLVLGASILVGCSASAVPATIPNTVPATMSPALSTATTMPVATDTAPPTAAATLPAPSSTPTPTPILLATPMFTPTVTVRGTPVNPNSSIDPLVQQARAALAARLGVTPSSIVVSSAEMVEWPDSSLGCPQPGRVYLQVITPGVLIRLEANGKTYEYHGDMRHFSLCENKP